MRVSHGRARAENYRPAALPPAVPAAPDRDPRTGRFVKGNRAGARRAALARMRRGLMGIDADAADPWIASYLRDGQRHCARLIAELPPSARGAMCDALAEETAAASTVARALLNLAAGAADPGERAALLREARSWTHQARAGALALAGLARTEATEADAEADLGWLRVEPVPDSNQHGVARSESTPGPRPRRGDPKTRSDPQKNEVNDEPESL